MPVIQLPAAQVAAGQGHLPPICPRHGRPATESKAVKLQSKPPAWAAILIIAGVILYLIVVLALRKTVKAPAWPWCDECTAQKKKMLLIGLPILGLGLLLFIIGIGSGNSDIGPLLLLLGFVALLAGIIVAARGGVLAVTGAFVSKDGQWVEVKNGSEQFLQALHQGRARV